MAHAFTTTDVYPKSGVLTRLADWASLKMHKISENNPRLRRVRTFQAMNDTQLAALGIERDQIVHLVFKDVYYT